MRCCPDNEAVSCADLRDWSAEFEELTGRISGLFVHPKSRLHARRYLGGLLAPVGGFARRSRGFVRPPELPLARPPLSGGAVGADRTEERVDDRRVRR